MTPKSGHPKGNGRQSSRGDLLTEEKVRPYISSDKTFPDVTFEEHPPSPPAHTVC